MAPSSALSIADFAHKPDVNSSTKLLKQQFVWTKDAAAPNTAIKVAMYNVYEGDFVGGEGSSSCSGSFSCVLSVPSCSSSTSPLSSFVVSSFYVSCTIFMEYP